jgi:hypothetical protein
VTLCMLRHPHASACTTAATRWPRLSVSPKQAIGPISAGHISSALCRLEPATPSLKCPAPREHTPAHPSPAFIGCRRNHRGLQRAAERHAGAE